MVPPSNIVHDFSFNQWGHACYSFTLERVKLKRTLIQRWCDKASNRRFFSVVCYCKQHLFPMPNDLIRYKVDRGIATGQIFLVDCLGVPAGRCKITFFRDNHIDSIYNIAEPIGIQSYSSMFQP